MIVLGDSGLLRPGRWRWLAALGWMVALFVVMSVLLFPGWLHAAPAYRDAVRIGSVLVAYAVYALAVRYGERRAPVEIAARPLLPELLAGIAIGAGMFALVFTSLRLLGVYTLAPGQWGDWPSDIVWALRTGFAEELLLRLVVFRLLMRAAGLWPALAISALLFGAMHLANPNATLVAALAIAVEAGLMLAAFYLVTGRIWMAVGVHAAWNFVQGPVFGARVSGGTDTGSLFVSAPVQGSPDWLSGGAFGPEASLPAVIVGFVIFVVVLRAALRRWNREPVR
ncbi:CPBP family intramembrane glutamic endopeptidase [Sphingomonas sp. S6]|jgi:membrane protease YdiL (CAAX protease family)|uniref:CPBP family intramembrane glutamic endopeptidase n=1 Tax=Sphingomonas sp. S6 TaxID=3368600 RepID=UPI000FA9C122|nr:type II CAAX endopeptidase family protein [uncultured Sphingomonas sp.]RTL14465.1 MAG: CPBP family intramembrane metalloprotease [Sphingomonadaceae bacterium]